MTAQIEPKTWVQCVDDSGLDPGVEDPPRLNGVYFVESVEPGLHWETRELHIGLLLSGCNPNCVWSARRFRPLGGNSSQIERKARVSEPA